MVTSVAVLTTSAVLLLGGIAHADNLQDTIAANATSVALVAGSATTGSASIRLIGNSSQGDPDAGCNIDQGDAPLVLKVVTPVGITANPNPLSITDCSTPFPVSFTASTAAQSGTVTVDVVSQPAGGGTYNNQVSIPITVTQPVPTPPSNTKPSVTVTGVSSGASYEIGAVPNATCAISDTEDGNSTSAAVVSGTLAHGLGQLTATCDYTDHGGLAATTATSNFSIVDKTVPTISHSLSPSVANVNGWYNSDVVVHFGCADG
jgi:hypothetical protein